MFAGLVSTFAINVLFIFMAMLGALINPKFNDIYVKLTKKEPLKEKYRIIASVVSFLMIYVAMGVHSLSNDKVSTTNNKEVFTEVTTASTTTKATTTTTVTEKVTTTTEKVTTAEVTTTTEEVTTMEAETEATTKNRRNSQFHTAKF